MFVFYKKLFEFLEKEILKIGVFHRFKGLFKSNQTRYGVSPVSVEFKTKRIFGMACLGKNLGFHAEFCELCE